ncbi:MAG TPA: hypothetical protein VGV87_17755 [Blastocatellia bacterium]|jgi:hypothetical protein|nr:hypothetical protein [Blastocatellia bacterium]
MGRILSLQEQWWPEIRDLESARKAAIQGFAAAILNVVIGLAFAAWAAFKAVFFGLNAAALLIAAVIFGAIAIGIWRLSQVAAVAGLVLFLPEVIWWLLNDHSVTDIVRTLISAIVFGLLFVNGIRGTFAYRRFMAGEPHAGAPRLSRNEKPVL